MLTTESKLLSCHHFYVANGFPTCEKEKWKLVRQETTVRWQGNGGYGALVPNATLVKSCCTQWSVQPSEHSTFGSLKPKLKDTVPKNLFESLYYHKIHTGVLRAGVIIQPPEITTFCSKLDLLFWTLSCNFCNTAIIKLTEPISIDICDLHPVVPEPISGRYHLPLCYTLKTVLNWFTGLSVNTCSWWLNTHYGCQEDTNTVLWHWCASGIQDTPSATFCATNCRCTACGPWPSPRSRRLTAWPSASTTVFVFSNAGKARSILISCSLLCRSTFQAVKMSVHKSQWVLAHSALAQSFYRQAHKLKARNTGTETQKLQFVSNCQISL